VQALKWLAVKAMIGIFLFLVLPLALWNARVFLFDKVMPYILDSLDFEPIAYEFIGVAGWFLSQLKLDICLGIVFAGYLTRFFLSLVK
jgi:hypothetical protein